MVRRGSHKDEDPDIIMCGTIGSTIVLDLAHRSFEVRELMKGPSATRNGPADLALLTLEVTLHSLMISDALASSFLGSGERLSVESMKELIDESISVYEDPDHEIPHEHGPEALRHAAVILDQAFAREARKGVGAEQAKQFITVAIGVIAARHWYRPRVKAGPSEGNKRQRRTLNTVHLSALLGSQDACGTDRGNEADLVSAKDAWGPVHLHLDLEAAMEEAKAALSDLEWAVYEAYTLDDDATLELLADREWPGGTKLSQKQIRRILARGAETLQRVLGPAYKYAHVDN
jgi:hypothetical protein